MPVLGSVGLAHGKTHAMHLSPIGYTLVRFMLECAGFSIIKMTYDKKKPKQLFLKPLVWLIRLYALSWSKKKRAVLAFGDTG